MSEGGNRGLSRDQLAGELTDLLAQGDVRISTNPKTGKTGFELTPKGQKKALERKVERELKRKGAPES